MIEDIREFEDRRFAAVLSSNAEALAPLLHEDLRYVHSDGTTQNRDQYLADLSDGVWAYREIYRSNETILMRTETALVLNQLNMSVVFRGDIHAVNSTALSVWVLEKDKWQLIAVQSTAIPSPAKVIRD